MSCSARCAASAWPTRRSPTRPAARSPETAEARRADKNRRAARQGSLRFRLPERPGVAPGRRKPRQRPRFAGLTRAAAARQDAAKHSAHRRRDRYRTVENRSASRPTQNRAQLRAALKSHPNHCVNKWRPEKCGLGAWSTLSLPLCAPRLSNPTTRRRDGRARCDRPAISPGS